MSRRREGEAEWLRSYDPRAFPPFALTVDLVVFTLLDQALSILLVQRREHPFRGWWALPGGHVRQGDESAEAAARRELAEETGFASQAMGLHLEQLATYSEPTRDPRSAVGLQVVSVGFVAIAPRLPQPIAGTDAAAAAWWPVASVVPAKNAASLHLAFDHATILTDALERIRGKLEYSPLAFDFLEEPFSLSELRSVYSAIWGERIDPANFRRKILGVPGLVAPSVGIQSRSRPQSGRPPELYVRGTADRIYPPLARRSKSP